jgi:hypothetical protein
MRSPDLRILKWGEDFGARDLPESEIDFLVRLGGPTMIAVPGEDATRTRVVTTLLHGNEPSGLRAIHRWLRAGRRPATNGLLLIASVDTALTEPHFSHRHLPDRRDLNRCFLPPWKDAEGKLARDVVETILSSEPECVVDIHNNTGHNPAYGVSFRIGQHELGLVALFADRVVHAPLKLGTLVEATIDHCPSVTIECGRAGDPAADEAAYVGLLRLLEESDLELSAPGPPMRILGEPIRVCAEGDVSLAFADTPSPEAQLTISADIDRHNFELLPAGAQIGWAQPAMGWPLIARRPDGTECSREMFRLHGNVLETRLDFVPIMMTTLPAIAKSDCLFYAARDVGPMDGVRNLAGDTD